MLAVKKSLQKKIAVSLANFDLYSWKRKAGGEM